MYNVSMKKIVKKLMRKQKIKTPYQLAILMSENPQKVCNWFVDGRDIPFKYIYKLSSVFNVPVEHFLHKNSMAS